MEIVEEVVKCRSASPDEEHLSDNLEVLPLKTNEHLCSMQPLDGAVLCTTESLHRNSSHISLPFCPITGGARSSQEILAMQPSGIDRKREAFLEHLKQKYPLRAIIIMGHQERLREQVSSNLEEALGQIQNSLQGLYIPSGMRTPRKPPGGARECYWRRNA